MTYKRQYKSTQTKPGSVVTLVPIRTVFLASVASQILRVDKGRIGEGKIIRTNGF